MDPLVTFVVVGAAVIGAVLLLLVGIRWFRSGDFGVGGPVLALIGLVLMGFLLFRTVEFKVGEVAFKAVIAEVQTTKGLILQQQGQPREALAAFQAAEAITPQDPVVKKGLADAYRATGDLPNAEQNYRELVKLDPKSAQARADLASVLVDRRQFNEAVTVLNEARKLDPQNPRVERSLGSALLAKGDTRAAREVFANALEQHPLDESIRAGLARVYVDEGNVSAATEVLNASTDPGMKNLAATLKPGSLDKASRALAQREKRPN